MVYGDELGRGGHRLSQNDHTSVYIVIGGSVTNIATAIPPSHQCFHTSLKQGATIHKRNGI